MNYFVIVGPKDKFIYETYLGNSKDTVGGSGFPPHIRDLLPFILHSSLDLVYANKWGKDSEGLDNSRCYLGLLDFFFGLPITAYVTYSGIMFLMLHFNNQILRKLDTGIIDPTSNSKTAKQLAAIAPRVKNGYVEVFYREVHELYIKTLMNPFYHMGDPITSPLFSRKVHRLSKRYLH
ncbi:hypothetical protein TBLA_0J01630 [Henningerozyma blattae CBS 6284]|uniref:Trafficking protein particle complex subunit n=1 Tax=Henningerozyma blattae (strain ATCC 34711 / CBS 6284 / DSM 70876 / NBRC 10599 / NRRL Y-10934 / UCD 77-7) TaxID=1071380 RepID=I2H9V6_HENB6|nr:hypothetical protein TBLA_0J01630 [Tetrapisispora blattae CBS 6284]CCH63158.1 hypothetical protein TBLA_0J01630 [Tetrapisispora blattae CBS 6284]